MVVPGIKSPGSVITGSGPVSNRPDSDSPDSIIPGSTNPSSKYQYERKQSSSRRGASVSPEFVAQVYETTQQLKRRSLARRGLLDPLNSSLLLKWDIVTALALLFTATLTPFEIAFIDQAESPANAWFIVNRVVDLIFIVDMVLQFFIAYEDRRKNKAHGTGFFYTREVIWDRRRICRHYLLGSFSVDLVSILPSFLDVLPLMTQESNIGIDTRAMRALRVLRLIKLIRLMRAQRVISRVSSRISISHTSQTLISCLVAILLASHWYACIMALQASFHPSLSDTFLGTFGYCDDSFATSTEATTESGGGVLARKLARECPGLDLAQWYIAAFSWSSMVITGTGGTDAYPSKNSVAETILVVFLVIFGALLWTQVLAAFCDMATNADPGAIEYRQLVDEVNRFCHQEKLPQELQIRLRQYFAQRRHILKARSTTSVVHKMSSTLQQEVTLLVQYHWRKCSPRLDPSASVLARSLARLQSQIPCPATETVNTLLTALVACSQSVIFGFSKDVRRDALLLSLLLRRAVVTLRPKCLR